jgi:hypothetical protein
LVEKIVICPGGDPLRDDVNPNWLDDRYPPWLVKIGDFYIAGNVFASIREGEPSTPPPPFLLKFHVSRLLGRLPADDIPGESPLALTSILPCWLSGLACWCYSVVHILPKFSQDTCRYILLSYLVSDAVYPTVVPGVRHTRSTTSCL